MTKNTKRDLKLVVARAAMKSYEQLTRAERVQLLRGLALILPKREAAAAEQTAWMLEKAEDHQLKFSALLGTDQ